MPPAFMRGCPKGGGSPAALRFRRRVAIDATPYRILPPVLRCAWTSPLINEGGKRVRCLSSVLWLSIHHCRKAAILGPLAEGAVGVSRLGEYPIDRGDTPSVMLRMTAPPVGSQEAKRSAAISCGALKIIL